MRGSDGRMGGGIGGNGTAGLNGIPGQIGADAPTVNTYVITTIFNNWAVPSLSLILVVEMEEEVETEEEVEMEGRGVSFNL